MTSTLYDINKVLEVTKLIPRPWNAMIALVQVGDMARKL